MKNKPYSWLEISKSALLHNATCYKKLISPGLLAPVIKANGYGHDLQLIGTVLNESLNVDYLCVAYLSEALKLRANGINKPILVLSCIDDNPAYAAHNTIEFVVSTEQDLTLIEKSTPKKPIGVHLKIDTGLSRFGASPTSALKIAQRIIQSPFVTLRGICTHFAESNNQDQTFTQHQKNIFQKTLEQLHTAGITAPLIHTANSAATTTLAMPECNFFRVGIGIYGWWPSQSIKERTLKNNPYFKLKPAITWKTYIDNIKIIPSDTHVGYDRTFKTTRETRAAFLPIGYADGYDFRLANKGKVLINNTIAPVIGKICMNVVTIDITHVPNAQRNDTVTLLGNYPGLTAYDLAHLNGSNNAREAIVRINPTLLRILID